MSENFTVLLADLVSITPAGVELNPGIVNVSKAKRLPIKTQYQLSKIAKRLAQEVRDFAETRMALIRELGTEDEPGSDRWSVSGKNLAEFNRKVMELLDTEVVIDLRPLKLEELGDAEGTCAEDFVACQAFILD